MVQCLAEARKLFVDARKIDEIIESNEAISLTGFCVTTRYKLVCFPHFSIICMHYILGSFSLILKTQCDWLIFLMKENKNIAPHCKILHQYICR